MNPTNTSNTEPQEAPWATQAQPHRGRVAVVTGAARGIGLEIALRLARDGAHLALADTDGEQLAVAAQAVRQAGAEVITQVGDLSLEASANELMAAALAAFGRIDMRLAERLLALARDSDEVHATHQELARELGTAREVISRQLTEFHRRGWIDQARGRVSLADRPALEIIAQG